jgi:cytochrome c peroxidase
VSRKLMISELLLAAWLLAGLSPGANADSPALSLPAQVGVKLFFDKNLSGSGQMSCASCHDPSHHYAQANDLAVQLGGPNLDQSGTRAVPSLKYKEYTPPYADLFDNPDGVSAPGPGGGLMQDGRAATLADQVQFPLLAANEMANKSAADVVNKIRSSDYVDLFKQAFGSSVLDNTQTAFAAAGAALQAYQLEDVSFHPYSSKYDLYAANKIGGTLTASEARGLAVFMDENKGNCFACHYSGAGVNGSVAIFTDFSFEAIGVPRNNDIPVNRKALGGLPVSYDLGICNRPDHPPLASAQYCGMFKTPTLRNVATRKVFFHNGRFKTLTDVIHFYNTRDTNPELWYPIVNGVAQKFDDLPTRYRGNIDASVPLDGRAAGSQPAMTPQDEEDLIAFLNTLTDGYVPPGSGTGTP